MQVWGNDISLHNCHNCIVHTAGEKQVVVEGLDGYIIAERNGALLVCSLKRRTKYQTFYPKTKLVMKRNSKNVSVYSHATINRKQLFFNDQLPKKIMTVNWKSSVTN